MSPEERAELRRLSDRATPGPWGTWPDGAEESVESTSVGRFVCHLNSNMRGFREDAAFISASRTAVPVLLDALDAAEARAEGAEAALAQIVKYRYTDLAALIARDGPYADLVERKLKAAEARIAELTAAILSALDDLERRDEVGALDTLRVALAATADEGGS